MCSTEVFLLYSYFNLQCLDVRFIYCLHSAKQFCFSISIYAYITVILLSYLYSLIGTMQWSATIYHTRVHTWASGRIRRTCLGGVLYMFISQLPISFHLMPRCLSFHNWLPCNMIYFSSSPMDKMAAILTDDNFSDIFLNEDEHDDRIPIRIWLKFVPRSPIDDKLALYGAKPLAEPMLT